MTQQRQPPANLNAAAAFRVASTLAEVQAELRYSARALDFYAGYNLAASIEDRLDEIGRVPDEENTGSTAVASGRNQVTRRGRPTEVARLLLLREQALAAIAAARDLGALVRSEQPSEGLVPTEDPNTYVARDD